MALPAYDVTLDLPDTAGSDTVTHRVTIRHGDQLRAELEGPKHGLRDPKETPFHYMTLWVWAALVRTGVVTAGFRDFTATVVTVDPVPDDLPADPDAPAVGVPDPTRPDLLTGSP